MPYKNNGQFRLTKAGILTTQIANSPSGEFPYTLFLGAGASVTSGIPERSELISEWEKEIYCHTKDIPISQLKNNDNALGKWKSNEYPKWLSTLKEDLNQTSEYGVLFQYTRKTKEERQMFIEQLFADRIPSPGYMYLAGLINAGKFNRILTTNFDDLLTDALVKYYGIKPINCAFDSAVTSFSNTSLRPKIIKLHGDFLYENIRNTDDELVTLGKNMEDKMIEMCEDRGLIVVGYSGDDESVMTPITENLRRNKKFLTKGIHWCLYNPHFCNSTNDAKKESHIPERLRFIAKNYSDRVFLYSIRGFDSFMESAFTKSGLELPDTVLNPYNKNATYDFFKSCRELRNNDRITPQLYSHMQKILEHMEKPPDKIQHILRKAEVTWGCGAALRDKDKDYKEAIKKFEEALDIIVELEPFKEEITISKKLQALSRKMACFIGIAKCLNSLGRPYAEELEKKAETFKQALTLESLVHSQEETTDLESVYFNHLCALGIEAKFAGKVTKDIEKEALETLKKLKASSSGYKRLKKFNEEPDSEMLRPILKIFL